VDRHGAAIHRLAVAVVGPDEAGDVTQDVLVRAWQHRGQLQDPAAESAWLRRVVINRCLDHRRASNRRVRTIPMAIAQIDLDQGSAPEAQLPGFDPAIEAALRRLPVEQRAVIALHYVADLAIADVAATLRVPVGTAKSRLAAALERLRRDLGAVR
jgi:RNA polymerase sigma-70 factor (ECF subfamily)